MNNSKEQAAGENVNGKSMVIVATFKASEGKLYRYPLTLRFIS